MRSSSILSIRRLIGTCFHWYTVLVLDICDHNSPSFILSPVSLVEFSAYWGEPCDELAAISSGATPEERMLRVVRWFIMTLKVSKHHPWRRHGACSSVGQLPRGSSRTGWKRVCISVKAEM